MANMAGIGGIAAKIRDVIKDLRKPIDKAIEKVVGFVVDKARALMGRKEEPATTEEKESPEKTEKVSHGLTAIDQEEEKYLENNKISREDAEKVAVTVKRTHPVFKSLTIVDGGDTWDYDYVASPSRIKEGPEKVEGKKGKAERLGGAYKDITANGGEVHHMPADSVSPFTKGKGPAIRMDTMDHKKTNSWGNSKKAKEYRKKQKELIEKGRFIEAQQMDIDDVRAKFGDKYDEGIKQMVIYTKELGV